MSIRIDFRLLSRNLLSKTSRLKRCIKMLLSPKSKWILLFQITSLRKVHFVIRSKTLSSNFGTFSKVRNQKLFKLIIIFYGFFLDELLELRKI